MPAASSSAQPTDTPCTVTGAAPQTALGWTQEGLGCVTTELRALLPCLVMLQHHQHFSPAPTCAAAQRNPFPSLPFPSLPSLAQLVRLRKPLKLRGRRALFTQSSSPFILQWYKALLTAPGRGNLSCWTSRFMSPWDR